MTDVWEGYIEDIDGDVIYCRLVSPSDDEFTAEIDRVNFPEKERDSLELGSIFQVKPDGEIEFLYWTEEELKEAKQRAREEFEQLKVLFE